MGDATRELIALQMAIEDIRDHATPAGIADPNDPDGNPHHYLLTVGALHRALGVLAGGVPVTWEREIARRLALRGL